MGKSGKVSNEILFYY